MAQFVLIHGAWHGAWCWRRVLPLLREAGHEAHAITLTGVGERAHLLAPGVGLKTHVQDAIGVVLGEELTDAVLVGHSYAGLVITGTITVYVEPGNARESFLIQKLNPVRQFPTQDMSQRAFDVGEFPAHAAAVGQELTADEYYQLILMADNGGQFYSRENAPGGEY